MTSVVYYCRRCYFAMCIWNCSLVAARPRLARLMWLVWFVRLMRLVRLVLFSLLVNARELVVKATAASSAVR